MVQNYSYDQVVARLLSLKDGDEKEGDFAQRIGISPGTLTSYKKGKGSFGLHEITKICDVLKIDPHWLLFGTKTDEVVEVARVIDSGLLISPTMVSLPLYDAVLSAGSGMIATSEQASSEVSLQRQLLYDLGGSPEFCYIVQARGDSMWPTIPDGAYLIVDGSKTVPEDGLIYHFNVNERVVVKRARWRMDGRLYLTSDNAAAGYPEESFAADRVDDLHVGGKVLYVMHEPLPALR